MTARLFVCFLALLGTGCTTAGPFVTSISSDGRGNLVIEKSMVQMNSFTGTVSNHASTTTTIRLFDLHEIERVVRMQTEPPAAAAPVWTGNRNVARD